MSKNFRTGILITGDSSGAVRSIKLTDEQLEKLNQTKGQADSRAKRLVDMYGKLATAAAAVVAAGAAVAAGVAVQVRKQMDLISSTADVAEMLGMTTDALTRLRHQAEMTGVANNNLDMGVRRMTRRISEAAQGTGSAVSALDELGLSAERLAQMSPDQQFDAISVAMQGVQNQSDKLRIAFKIFDTDGAALVRTMAAGAEGAAEAARYTQQWGLALDDIQSQKVAQASDAIDLATKAGEGFWKQLTVQLSPAITGVATELLSWGESFGSAEGAAASAYEKMVTGIGFVGDAARGLHVVWKGLVVVTAEWWALMAEAIAGADIMLTDFLNKLPGFMGGGGYQYNQVIQGTFHTLRATADKLSAELGELVNKAMPSDVIKQKFSEWEKSAQESAEKAAAALAQNRNAYAETAEGVEALTNAEKKRAEQAAKTLGDLTFQNQLLERELIATRAGEDALKAFNREKHIEIGLRGRNAEEMLPEEIALYQEQLALQWDLQDAIREAGKVTEQTGDDMAKLMEETSRRMGDSMVAVWRDFIEGGRTALDSLKSMFTDFLANMAHLAITRPIMVSMGLAAAPGGAQASGGLGAIASGGQSLSSLFSLGSLMKGGGILAGANNAIGQLAGNAIQFAYNQGWTTAGNLGVQWANNMASMPGGMAGGLAINALAGYAGNWAGNQIGGALTGKQANSAWGGTIGSVVGSIWGPLGTAIGGAIGGLVDSIFGSSGKKRVTLGVDTDPNVIAGSRGYTDHQVRGASGILYSGRETRGDEDVANKMVDLFALTDTALTGVFRTLTGITPDLTGQSLVGKMHQAGKKGEGSFFGSAEYNKLMEEDLRGATDEFVRAWVNRVNEVTEQAVDFAPLFELAQEGELLADALVRLDTQFHGVDATLRALDLTAYDTSVTGMKMADSLVQAAGGLDRFITGTDAYYRNFYGQNERFASVSRQLAAEFDTLGQLIPATRDGVRDIIDSLDLMTDAGQKTFAAIMNASEGLSEYYNLLEQYQQSITSGFDDFRSQLMMDILGDAGAQYDYLKAQADALGQVLPTLQDADAIARVKEEILDLSRQAYGLLDQEGKRQAAPEYVSMIDELERVSIEQLKQAQQQSADNADRVAGAVEKAMAHVTTEFQRVLAAVVQDQQQAGQLLMSATSQFGSFASSFPSRIQLNVTMPEAGAY